MERFKKLVLMCPFLPFFQLGASIFVGSIDTIVNGKQEKVNTLNEFVVEAGNRKDIKGGVAFFPDKRDKKFATDAISLIENMALAELPYDIAKKTVTNASGVPVVYFIDGKEASSKDLNALNPKDVDRIEYFQMPTDASFAGKQNVVNFVMKRYLSGGFTKIVATQYLNGRSGNYGISSKFAYKEMTYDLYLTGSYRNLKHSGSEGRNIYKDFEYEGEEYDTLSELVDGRGKSSRTRKLGAMLKAAWAHRSLSLTFTGGWNWERIPSAGGYSATIYQPQIIRSTSYYSNRKTRGINPYLMTNMNLSLPHGQNLNILFKGQYASHDAAGVYHQENIDEIFNSSDNRRWTAFLMASYSKSFNAKNSMGLTFIGSKSWDKTEYGGSYNGLSRFEGHSFELKGSYSHTFRQGTFLSATAGMTNHATEYSSYKNSQWIPNLDITFRNKWNKISSITFSSGLTSYGYSGNVLNDVILRTSEFMWRKGVNSLDDRIWWQTSLSNSWNFTNRFSMTLTAIYTSIFNQDNSVWETIDGYDGLVRSTTDDATCRWIQVGPRFSLKLFRNKLVMTGDFKYRYWNLSGYYDKDYSSYSGSLSATWYGRKWYLKGSVVPATTIHDYNDIIKTYMGWEYTVSFGYSYKNFNLVASAHNPFSGRLYKVDWIDTEHYSQKMRYFSDFSSNVFSLKLTFTPSYGKKVSRTMSSPSDMLGSGAMDID